MPKINQNFQAQIPLEQHQDLGEHQLAFQQHEGAQLYHHGGAGFQQDHHHHHHGSAQVHQQINQHGSEHKVSVQHGHGESHQVFKQEHSHGHYEEGLHEHDHEKDKNVNYQFEYSVNDHKTGDVKRHKEERKGDVVNGEYSLLEEDGNVRTVKYYADWKTGFHAEVHNSKRSHG